MSKFESSTIIPEELSGKRLDFALSKLFPEHSRARIQNWIKAGDITVNKQNYKQKMPVATGDVIDIYAAIPDVEKHQAEPIAFNIIFEDESIIVLNKPAGLVVHPGAGNPAQTLVNGLLNHDQQLDKLPRAGIIHRLDKDTTGIMVVAKTLGAHTGLVKKLQQREIKREYQTLVCGQFTSGGLITHNIGRHPKQRVKMAVTQNGKPATTHYRIFKKYRHYTHLTVQLETGRTHQIRVHMSHINHPVIGDPVYGKNNSIRKGVDEALKKFIKNFNRQALHAHRLEFSHPVTDKLMKFEAGIPDDMQTLISYLDDYDRA